MPSLISYAQNGEDVRIWHAFGPRERQSADQPLIYVDVGANEPRELSLTAALYDLGWHGLLIEADPTLAKELRRQRPRDAVVEAAAASRSGEITFYRVLGTGLGTLDKAEARAAFERGFTVEETVVPCQRLDDILDEYLSDAQRDDEPEPPIHVMSIDVEGAEATVLDGLSLSKHRPWVLCIEAVEPGTTTPSHAAWESHLLRNRYRFVAFDGINRWYVADEQGERPVSDVAGAAPGTTIAEAIATPFNAIDIGAFGWRSAQTQKLEDGEHRSQHRQAWQRELILSDLREQVPTREYERQIDELRSAVVRVEGSRTFALSRKLANMGKRGMHFAHRIRRALPAPMNRALIRRRHLRHVTVNMGHLTNPAYLGNREPLTVTWLGEQRPPIPPGLRLTGFTEGDAALVRTWLSDYPFDRDLQLDARMDNHDDEVGRVHAALRTRLRLFDTPTNPHWAGGNRIAIDARALQSPAFGNRGIGRFAKAVVLGAREVLDDERITLIVDRGLHPLPEEIAGTCEQATAISDSEVAQFSMLIQPSPMTHSADPLIPLLHSNAFSVAIVYDFIPLHYPNVYLAHTAAHAEYAANLDALKRYSDFVCISRVTRDNLASVLGRPRTGPHALQAVVAWPRDIADAAKHPSQGFGDPSGPIVLLSGDDPRKNTFGGLAGIAVATTHEAERNVIVIGMTGHDDQVHHWSIAAAMRSGEAFTTGRMSDEELSDTLRAASCVVVPSFDEGLSLPILEAIRAGTPVAASGIAAHRELIGRGRFSFDPRKPRSIARAVARTRGKKGVWRRQARTLAKHSHTSLQAVVAKRITDHVRPAIVAPPPNPRRNSARLSVGVATPWPPQRTGVADFSQAVFTALAHNVDVTLYTTTDARVAEVPHPHARITQRSVQEILADPASVQSSHDAMISVIGNSHYHLPFVEVLRHVDAIAIAHDTRMVEYYMALRGRGGVEQTMLTTNELDAPGRISPPLDDQINDMRLLQNAGLWEVANRASTLVMHSPSAAPVITQQTGVPVTVLPFANYRAPDTDEMTAAERDAARERLGLNELPPETIHLGSFGYVDPRTKMIDVVVEAAAWLTQWGHSVALHLVGSASEGQIAQLAEQAERAGLRHFNITGFCDEAQFRDWLMAVDLGIQLRVSPLLGVSGPLSDFAAFGTPAVASEGLCVDVDTPDFIHRLPDAVSPVIVAEAVEHCLTYPVPEKLREQQRREYLQRKTPEHYAHLLLQLISEQAS